MVKYNTYICDRCQKVIPNSDEQISDFLKEEYPEMDICTDCDLIILLGSSTTKRDLVNNTKPGTTLKLMLERYQVKKEI